MRLLDRYLLREFLVSLGYCLSGFLLIWIAFDLMNQLHGMQERHLLPRDIAAYYFFRIPEFLPVTLPVALLLALLYALTNHARHNEITAMRAAGVSLWRLCAPYLAFGVLASLALFALNELCAPKSADVAEEILDRRLGQQPSARERQLVKDLKFRNSREHRFWYVGLYNQKTTEMLPPVLVEWRLPDGSWRELHAERAVRTNGVWTFFRVREVRQSARTNSLPVSLPYTNVLAMPEFSETPEEIRSHISIKERTERQSRTRRADVSIRDILNYLRLNPNLERTMRAWLYTKLYGRFAGSCTPLVVVLIAVPFAAGSGRRNVFVGVAASLSLFFVYYLLQQVGFALGEVGRVPAWLGAWLPNLAFGLTGIWLMARVR